VRITGSHRPRGGLDNPFVGFYIWIATGQAQYPAASGTGGAQALRHFDRGRRLQFGDTGSERKGKSHRLVSDPQLDLTFWENNGELRVSLNLNRNQNNQVIASGEILASQFCKLNGLYEDKN
jgi:hypothetical protein